MDTVAGSEDRVILTLLHMPLSSCTTAEVLLAWVDEGTGSKELAEDAMVGAVHSESCPKQLVSDLLRL